ncbi:dephospho-CoA kinase [Mesoplasma photuris]|uniref:dephospho-CoA kinase n=1 Tax=Mesoplasma photuris TaxID=217731 RepID=UPI00068C8E33|nr:dephospho-CoA kinase [Mesoplasma photuris]
MIIGIYGIIGSGKSTIAKYLAEQSGYKLIQLDEISKKVLSNEKILNELKKNDASIFSNEVLNRSAFRNKLFLNKKYANQINIILWPKIKEETLKEIDQENVIIDGAILPVLNILNIDKMIKISTSNDEINIDRVIKRDNVDKAQVIKIIEQQKELIKNFKFDLEINADNLNLSTLDILEIVKKTK